MAITSDGTQAFGIQDSPVTINSVTYVAEALNFTYPANRVDINDSNGEPLGATIVPGRVEFSGTVQLASDATAVPAIGQEMVLSGGRTTGTFLITEASDAQTQGDYAKVSLSGYKKTN